jgi:glycosyltransferase involved in cell wall biosynthesis
MNNQPQVSVIVPCFNQAIYLADALESIALQTYQNLEVIVIDDGSTDGNEAILRSVCAIYQQRFALKLLAIPNSGVALARNTAISQSTGEYILPLDADDKLHPSFIETTLSVMRSLPSVSIVYTDYELFGDVNQYMHSEEYEYSRFLYEKNLCASTALFKRRAWLDAGGYNPNMIWGFEDWEFWISCAAKQHFGKRVARSLFYYRKKIEGGTRNTGANANSPRLFARMALNHPNLYPTHRLKWAAHEWANALVHIFESNDPAGLRYIKNLPLARLEAEAALLKKLEVPVVTMKLYEYWIQHSSATDKQSAIFHHGLELETSGRQHEALECFTKCLSDTSYKIPAELAIKRITQQLRV